MTSPQWRCPLCKTLADDGRAHLAEVHGLGSGPDRFGLRDAARPPGRDPGRRPAPPDDLTGRPPDGAPGRGADDAADRDDPGRGVGPPLWRQVTPPRRGRGGADGRNGGSDGSGAGLRWRVARRPRGAGRLPSEPPEPAPPKPVPLPPEAAVLRLICETLDGVDAAVLRDRLLELPAVESVALDLYERTADLYIDRGRATPRHLVAMATSRLRLPVRAAEIHRAAPRGERLGDATRLFVLQ